MVKRETFENIFQGLCEQHRILLFLNDKNVLKDNGYAIDNEVHLGRKYSSISVYMAVAFHEFGHAIINQKRMNGVRNYNLDSYFYEEFFAWFLAQRYYSLVFKKPFSKKMGDFILECLKSHSRSHYSFKDLFGDNKPKLKKTK